MRTRTDNPAPLARQPGDNGCREVNINDALPYLTAQRIPNTTHLNIFQSLSRWVSHVNYFEIQSLHTEQRRSDIHERVNVADWIIKDITQERFTSLLLIKDKRDQFRTEIIQVVTTFVNVMTDLIVNKIRSYKNSHGRWNVDDIRQFLRYIYDQLKTIGVVYKLKTVDKYLVPNSLSTKKLVSDLVEE